MDHDLFEKCTALRHEIHMYPDLSNEERPTFERILAFLKKNTNNIEIHDAGHYVWCAYRSPDPKKPNMGFRGDCDALPMEDLIDQPWRSRIPGKAHTCGHDGHTAALAGLILSLDRYGADRDVFCVFQPAEENGTGAIACMDFITDNHVQQFFSVHGRGKSYPFSIATRKGTLQCASKGMTVTMTGIPAHAGNPEDGKNPSMVLCALAEYSRTVLQDPKFTKFVLVTIIHLGIGKENAFGISAGTGKLQMTIRAEDEAELEELRAAAIREEKAAKRAAMGITEEEIPASQVGNRRYARGRAYVPDRYTHPSAAAEATAAAAAESENWVAAEEVANTVEASVEESSFVTDEFATEVSDSAEDVLYGDDDDAEEAFDAFDDNPDDAEEDEE